MYTCTYPSRPYQTSRGGLPMSYSSTMYDARPHGGGGTGPNPPTNIVDFGGFDSSTI